MEQGDEMSSAKVGERVGAIMSRKEGTIKLFGYGVRIVDEVPEGAAELGGFLSAIEITNPTILLDSGKKVYGCECWWGPEEKIKKLCEGVGLVEEVDIDAERLRLM